MRASARNRRSIVARAARTPLTVLLLIAPLAACSAGKDTTSSAHPGDGSVTNDSGGFDFDASGLESGGSDASAPVVSTLTGVVKAPEGTIGISGALVYVVATAPDPIPSGVYCDECVKLESGTPYTFSNADGSFSLGATSTGSLYLVVQKGQFRRVRPINVTPGAVAVPLASTTLPKKTDNAAGDTIPHMAIVNGAWDKIELSLAALGLGTVINNAGPLHIEKGVDIATAPYDFYAGAPSLSPGSKGDYTKILSDYSVLSQYHVIFLPCSWSNQTTCNVTQPSTDPKVKQNLQQFVKAGGKLYATDYSYEFVRQVFPGYVDWKEEKAAVGSACLPGSWDGAASSPDKGLTDWLGAQGITTFTVQQNWTALDSVHAQMTTDGKGAPLLETPKIWVNANASGYGTIPTTVSFQQACGRVLYSTYHTEGTATGLLPQERALLYILLEVGVCVGQVSIK